MTGKSLSEYVLSKSLGDLKMRLREEGIDFLVEGTCEFLDYLEVGNAGKKNTMGFREKLDGLFDYSKELEFDVSVQLKSYGGLLYEYGLIDDAIPYGLNMKREGSGLLRTFEQEIPLKPIVPLDVRIIETTPDIRAYLDSVD